MLCVCLFKSLNICDYAMCVCVYLYIYIYIYIYIYSLPHKKDASSLYVYVCSCLYICLKCIRLCIWTKSAPRIYMRICIYINKRRLCENARIFIRTSIYIHARMPKTVTPAWTHTKRYTEAMRVHVWIRIYVSMHVRPLVCFMCIGYKSACMHACMSTCECKCRNLLVHVCMCLYLCSAYTSVFFGAYVHVCVCV